MATCPHCDSDTPDSGPNCAACGRSVTFDAHRTITDSRTHLRGAAPSAGPAASPDEGHLGSAIVPGQHFAGRYRIERVLGAGGMGAVYRAFDEELGVTVALKVIRAEVAPGSAAARDYELRFKQELLLARQVSHPNVVRIHDLGDADGTKYITMSYVEGADLGTILRHGALPLERARALALQLVAGLAAAHDVGVAHRDLKPANLLVDERDQLCISDFGLAKSMAPAAAGLTRTGEFLGTPRYIAPEQVEGKPADQRGDIYAVGLILYEMVTGDVPFAGSSAIEQMLQRVQHPPAPARTRNPEVPVYLDDIIMRCLERDPLRRYQSAHDLLADLRGGHSTAAAPLPSATPLPAAATAPTRRRWYLAALAAVVALTLAVPSLRRLATAPAPAPAAATADVRVAVLPFTVAGDADALDAAAAGLEESLSSKLFQAREVRVAAAPDVARAMRAHADPGGIGRYLGAAFVVSGMVQGSADRVRATVHLDDVAGGTRVWSREFSGVPADLLALEDSAFAALLPELGVTLTPAEQAAVVAHPTENIAAYGHYLKGRLAMRNDQDLDNVRAAIESYEEARRLDPRFALAYAGIADSSVRMYRAEKDPVWTARALAAAQQAVSIDDSLVEAHLALGTALLEVGRTNEAFAELKAAADRAPNSDDAHRRLGRAYLRNGRGEDAVAAYQRAVDINPYYWVNMASLGVAHMSLADYAAAVDDFRRATQVAPDNAAGWNDLGAALLQVGDHDGAVKAFGQALALQPIADTYTNLGIAYAQAGRFEDAVGQFRRATELEPASEQFAGNLADGFRWAGRPDQAAAEYDRAIALASKDLQASPRNASVLGNLALYHAKKGDDAQARRFIGNARTIDEGNVDLLYSEAIVCALGGDRACATARLEQALREGYTFESIASDPDLRSLQGDPAFQALRERYGRDDRS